MTMERYRATGPDGDIAFSIDSKDQTPLQDAARTALAGKLAVSPDMLSASFTSITPTNDAARAALPLPRY